MKVGDDYLDLTAPLPVGAELEVITGAEPLGLEIIRHSTAHLMAQAVLHLFPEAKPTIGPAIEQGFYYDFATERPFTEEDLAAIEAEMHKLVKQNMPIQREEVSREECLVRYREMGNVFKAEIIEEIPQPRVTVYRQGDYFDLCRGPHVPSTGRLGAFKLLSIAGAYWRGDEKRPMLQRIYGTAFLTKEELDAYLQLREEAKRRDHRKLGRELGLFLVSPEVGAGLPLWLPKGAIVRNMLETFLRAELTKRGYLPVYTPVHRQAGPLPHLRALPLLQGEPVPAHHLHRGRARGRGRLSAEADELPAPYHHLQIGDAQLPRSAAAAGGIRQRLSLREERRAGRVDARARLHPG